MESTGYYKLIWDPKNMKGDGFNAGLRLNFRVMNAT